MLTAREIIMKRKLIAVAALFFAVSASSAFAEDWKGTITDSMCSTKHVAGTKDDVACAEKCMKMGDKAVLVVGDKVYKIDNQDAVAKHIGHKVNVTGTMVSEGTIHIDKVTM
jgi:hypothetical protein